MTNNRPITPVASELSRRRFVQGLGCGVFALATTGRLSWSSGIAERQVLSGREFDLAIDTLAVNFTGRPRTATAVNGQVPAPLLRWREGDTITLRVTNRLPVPSSIHWHGIILPADMDGVPGLSFEGIAPGTTYTYRFPVNQSGSYWYHSHSRFQEQTGLYGPIVIEPRGGARHDVDRDYTVLLSDWSDQDPEHVYATLKRHSDYFNFGKQTVGDFLKDVREMGWQSTVADRRMWGGMRMTPTDLADVSGYTYTYLMNGVTPAGNWTGEFRRGDKIRLRFINGSSMSIFDVRIPGLKMTVIAADGQGVEPVLVDEFRIGTAEVYDVMVEPRDDQPYTIFAQSLDRSGYARGTLAPRAGLQAQIPPLDPRPLLSTADMGMGHDMQGMADMEVPDIKHAPSEQTPGVDAQVLQAKNSLSDPGVGLRDNGRRVLTYADLRTIVGPIDQRPPEREIELHLTGHMERFMWSFDGKKYSESEPLRFKHGERLRVVLVNDSMMTHPIHLHGMWSELESPEGAFQVRKHTILVQPAQRLSYLVTADAIGRWAYHRHLLYHMEAGMFREVVVAAGSQPASGG
ncbi:MAG: copper resistance system multicopper oxidase [Steroidobacteraceae bacterium]